MKDLSEEAIKQTSIARPLREPRSTSSLRNLSSPSLAPFPASSSKNNTGADAFDVIVQASNPSHPQHAAWVERYGGSIRNTRKSIDGSSNSHQPSPSSTSQPPSLRRSRSRTASKVGSAQNTPNAKSRPALNDVMMVPDASVWTLLANQGDALGESENRRQASARERSVDETNTNKSYQEGSGSARLRTGSLDVKSDATAGGSSVKTSATDRGQRRKRKKEKGKARAAAPPVPPPRTTSHAAYQEQPQESLSPIYDQQAIGEGEANTSSPSLPYLSKRSFDANNSPLNLSPRLADDARLRHGADRMGSIDERGMDVQSPSLLSPTNTNAFPLRQSSVSPELPQGSPASTASSPPPTRTMFANLTQSLPGRRSVDFRLPDDDVVRLRQENVKSQRRGLDAIISPFRSAVAGRRADKQATAAQLPLQSEAKKPMPILRVATPTRASVDIMQRAAPTPPPRSPLGRTPIIQQEENNGINDGTAVIANPVQVKEVKLPTQSTMTTQNTDQEAKAGTAISHPPQNEAVAKKEEVMPAVNAVVENAIASPVERSQAKQSSTPSMQATNSSDATARSQKTFVSLPKSSSHNRSLSMDTEDGQEFHDAVSDEGGLGSSDDAIPSNTSTIKKRRSRHKSIEDVNAARLQAKEAALNEPLPDANKQLESIPFVTDTRQRRDSSASEDMIPTAGRKNSLRRKVSKKQIRTSAAKKDIILPPKPNSPRVELPDEKAIRNQAHRQSAATITNSNINRREVEVGAGDLDGRRKTVTQSSIDEKIAQPIERIDNEIALPKALPDIPYADYTPTQASNGFQQHDFGFSKSQSSRDIAESYRAAHRKAVEMGSIDYKQLPLPPPPPTSIPTSPIDENFKRQIAHQRSYSRMNQSQSGSNNSGKISGVFSRMRKDKTPSFSHLPGSDSHSTSLTGSTSQLNLVSPSQSPVQDDRNSGIGLGIDTASMQSSKGTNTSDQNFPSSPSPQHPVRSPSSEGGWRNRLPSFSASRAAKTSKGEKSRTDSNQQQPPPIPRQVSNSSIQRQQLLYEAVAHSMSDNLMAQRAVAPSPTIHKSLSPALLKEERHEADEVGSFIGSEEAEEERLADSRRGTWNSFSNFELAPNKTYDASAELSNSTSYQQPAIDIQGPAMVSIPKSNTTPSNLTSGSFSSPMTPQINEPNFHLRPSKSFSPDVMNLSMTARRLSRSSSNPKFQPIPQALDLSPGKTNNLHKQSSPPDGMEFEPYDDSRTSPFLSNSPAFHNSDGKEAFGSLSFPSSPGQSSITGSGSEPKRSRNLSIGSTLLGNFSGGNNNGNGSNTIKPRSSFAMDRDRSPVVNQPWADLPPSPSPRSSAVRKFFNSAAKSPLRPGKIRTASINALISPGRPSFQGGSPNDVSFPVSPALPSGQSAMFADVWKQDSPSSRTNGNAHTGMPSGSSFNSTSGYPLAQSASASSLQQTLSSHEHSSSQSSSPITQLRQASIPRGMPTSSLHSSTSLTDSLHKEWVAHNGTSNGVTGGSSTNAESVHSNLSSRNITSQRMIDSGSFAQSNSQNEVDLQAFGRMLRESAKEDAQRVRQIAQRSANNTPHLS